MRIGPILIAVIALALVPSCDRRRAREAMSYVEKCMPGTSFDSCRNALRPSDGHEEDLESAFPAGGLVAIRLNIMPAVIYPPPDQPLHFVIRTSFDYTMQARTGAAYATMVKTLQSDLGPPAHGRAPELGGPPKGRPPPAPGAIYWVTEEGVWATAPGGDLDWYSLPLEGYDQDTADRQHLDSFVRPAPQSAEVWRKVGRALIEQ